MAKLRIRAYGIKRPVWIFTLVALYLLSANMLYIFWLYRMRLRGIYLPSRYAVYVDYLMAWSKQRRNRKGYSDEKGNRNTQKSSRWKDVCEIVQGEDNL